MSDDPKIIKLYAVLPEGMEIDIDSFRKFLEIEFEKAFISEIEKEVKIRLYGTVSDNSNLIYTHPIFWYHKPK